MIEISPKFKIKWSTCTNIADLNMQDCHIFKFNLTDYNEIKSKYQWVLNQNELEKAKHFRIQNDSERYIIGKYFTRVLLGSKLGISPSKIFFFETVNKKPTTTGFDFNISHSGNFILIAISNSPIGIDVEFINPSFEFKSLLSQCFNPLELVQINNVFDFYKFWTRKEALMKATGEGIVDDLLAIDSSQKIIFRHNVPYFLSSYFLDDKHIYSIAKTSEVENLQFWNYEVFKN